LNQLVNDPSDTAASSASATLVASVLPTHPRTLEYTESILPGPIPDESELTARVKIEPGKRYGFFTDTSLCIGCKACEVACKEWNLLPADDIQISGMSYDDTRRLSATSWRHVTFVEKILEATGARDRDAAFSEQLADDERCLQALRERRHADDGSVGGCGGAQFRGGAEKVSEYRELAKRQGIVQCGRICHPEEQSSRRRVSYAEGGDAA
jgi:ferredoxin